MKESGWSGMEKIKTDNEQLTWKTNLGLTFQMLNSGRDYFNYTASWSTKKTIVTLQLGFYSCH